MVESDKKVTATPGPWKEIEEAEFSIWAKGKRICVVRYDTPTESDRANAALIAAAPEMYAWLVNEYSRCAPLSTQGRELAALIPKAEGRA